MSAVTSSHAYGIGLITILIGSAAGIGYYQMFYLPEELAKPSVDPHTLHPPDITNIDMIPGSALPDQTDNFIPKLVNIQLGVDNHVVWNNIDDTPHTVTPDHSVADSYSGKFGSEGVLKAGATYEFLFTEPHEISYHCDPHPWMTGTVVVSQARF